MRSRILFCCFVSAIACGLGFGVMGVSASESPAVAGATTGYAVQEESDQSESPSRADGADPAESDNGTTGVLVLYSILIVAASMFGGWLPSLIRLTHTRMQMLMSLVGGLMLGIGLFHLLPHGIHELGASQLDRGIWWMVVGVVTMFLLIRMFHFHSHDVPEPPGDHDHDHDHDQDGGCQHAHHHHAHGDAHQLSWLGVFLGLSLHTLIDGLALGASIRADAAHGEGWFFGIGTFVAILLHKPLDAVSITTLMKAGGWSRGAMNLVNAAFAMMCPLGAIVFVAGLSRFSQHQPVIIGCALTFSAGVFLCISLGDLLPEMEFHSHNRIPLTALLLAGLALAWAIRGLEPEHAHAVDDGHTHGAEGAEHDHAGHNHSH